MRRRVSRRVQDVPRCPAAVGAVKRERRRVPDSGDLEVGLCWGDEGGHAG